MHRAKSILVRFIVILHSSAIAGTPTTLQAYTSCEVFAVHFLQFSEHTTHIVAELIYIMDFYRSIV
jgi:hypothetical protein